MTQGNLQYRRDHGRQGGFTLVELLVVIAIIGILVALLLPAIQAARDAARRSQCQNQVKQISLAVLNYESAKKQLPAGSLSTGTAITGPYMSTWSVDILPYMEEQALFDQWDQTRSLHDTNANKAIRETIVQAYLCPTDIGTTELTMPETEPPLNALQWAPGSYRAVSGSATGENGDGYWDSPRGIDGDKVEADGRGPMHAILTTGRLQLKPVKMSQITDGTSKTLLVGEYITISHMPRRTFWSYPYTSYNQSSGIPYATNLLADFERCAQINLGGGGVNNCKRAWGSLHGGGVIQFAQCDGSVKSINNDIDMNIFAGMCTIAGEDDRGRGNTAPPVTPPPAR